MSVITQPRPASQEKSLSSPTVGRTGEYRVDTLGVLRMADVLRTALKLLV